MKNTNRKLSEIQAEQTAYLCCQFPIPFPQITKFQIEATKFLKDSITNYEKNSQTDFKVLISIEDSETLLTAHNKLSI